MLFDSHAHFDDERFNEDRDAVIMKAYENGVARILNASADLESCHASIELAHKYDFIYAAVGIHPHSAEDFDEGMLKTLGDLASDNRVVAIGEIGLDYFYDNSPRDAQKQCFLKQLKLSGDLGLPVIIHDRDAHEDTMDIIRKERPAGFRGVFHCYSGSVEMAAELLKRNFYLAFGGTVTFKNARRLVEAVKYVPIDRLLIETDCPYLTPEPFRGRRNDSGYVGLVAKKIAEIKGLDYEYVAQKTMQNANALFNLE